MDIMILVMALAIIGCLWIEAAIVIRLDHLLEAKGNEVAENS